MDDKLDYLRKKLAIETRPIGVYNLPGHFDLSDCFQPLPGKNTCLFSWFDQWIAGKGLRLTTDNFGCGGCGYWWFGIERRTRKEFVDFLCHEEGLKATPELMNSWLDATPPFKPRYDQFYVGPLRNDASEYLQTVTLFVNPDQLSALVIGANYFHQVGEPSPLGIAFGSSCSQMLTQVAGHAHPYAVIGALDTAMRRHLPPSVLAFTMNVALYHQLAEIGEDSFLNKGFLTGLRKARKGSIA